MRLNLLCLIIWKKWKKGCRWYGERFMKFIELLMKSELNNVQVLERTKVGSERVIKFSNPDEDGFYDKKLTYSLSKIPFEEVMPYFAHEVETIRHKVSTGIVDVVIAFYTDEEEPAGEFYEV